MTRKAAQKKERIDAPFDFEREAARAHRDHPVLLKDTCFVNMEEGGVVISPADRKKIAAWPGGRKNLKRCLAITGKQKYPAYFYKDFFDLPFNLVVLYSKRDRYRGFHPRGYGEGQAARALFDHEKGHALTWPRLWKKMRKWSQKFRLLSENLAEAVSLLDQYRRYGDHPRIAAEKLAEHRTADVIAGREEEIYHVAPALEKIAALKRDFDLAALTPRQQLALARRVVRETAPRDMRAVRRMRRMGVPDHRSSCI